MGWYFAPAFVNGKICSICKKPIKGKDVSQEEFGQDGFQETRDMVYFRENGNGADHFACVHQHNTS